MNETEDKRPPVSSDAHLVDVRDPRDGSLLFRYDPQRQVVEIRKKKTMYQVDLAQISYPQP